MSRNPPIQSINADLLDAALYVEDGENEPQPTSRATFYLAVSRAFDLAVGQPQGHAQRVAYAATALAQELAMDDRSVREVFFAALLQDASLATRERGAASDVRDRKRSSRVTRTLDGGAGSRGSVCAGAESADIAHRLGMDPGVVETLQALGAPPAYSLGRAAVTGAVLAVANRFEALVDDSAPALVLRRRLPAQLTAAARDLPYADIVAAMAGLACRDSFWLGFHDNDLPSHLARYDDERGMNASDLARAATVIAGIVDARNQRASGHSTHVAATARTVAEAAELETDRVEMIAMAAKLQDIGTLGIAAEILRKPDILTVEEMAQMQQHPTIARDLLSEVPGFGAVAWWIGCHHERIDGKGYPSMLSGREIPIEAQIIGMSEAYQALVSERPYRAPLQPEAAMDVVRGMAGTRFHPKLVDLFESVIG